MAGHNAALDLTTATFEEVIAGDIPVLVDFWSEFCAPCHVVGESITQLAQEMTDRLIVGKIDVLLQPDLARRYNVSSVPTLMLFKCGEPVVRLTGPRPKTHIIRAIEPHLG